VVKLKLFERADEQNDVPFFSSECGIYCAHQDGVLVGFCAFEYEGESVILLELDTNPKDMMLAIGLVRAALTAATNRMKSSVIIKARGSLVNIASYYNIPNDTELLIETILDNKECDNTN